MKIYLCARFPRYAEIQHATVGAEATHPTTVPQGV